MRYSGECGNRKGFILCNAAARGVTGTPTMPKAKRMPAFRDQYFTFYNLQFTGCNSVPCAQSVRAATSAPVSFASAGASMPGMSVKHHAQRELLYYIILCAPVVFVASEHFDIVRACMSDDDDDDDDE